SFHTAFWAGGALREIISGGPAEKPLCSYPKGALGDGPATNSLTLFQPSQGSVFFGSAQRQKYLLSTYKTGRHEAGLFRGSEACGLHQNAFNTTIIGVAYVVRHPVLAQHVLGHFHHDVVCIHLGFVLV